MVINSNEFEIWEIESIPAGNPFLHDLYHQGFQVAKNCTIMWGLTKDDKVKYVIIVNPLTGSRIRVVIDRAVLHRELHAAQIVNNNRMIADACDQGITPAEEK